MATLGAVITPEQMKKIKSNAIVDNMGPLRERRPQGPVAPVAKTEAASHRRNWWGCTKESYTLSHCASTQGDHCRRQPDDRRQQSGGDSRSDSGGNSRSDIKSDSGSDGAAHQAKGASCEDCEPLVIAASQMHASDLDEKGILCGAQVAHSEL